MDAQVSADAAVYLALVFPYNRERNDNGRQ